ncbi:phosphatase PAP2 family protein [Oceanobacillus alkalisoli]|uniref:phosphatase PAP2 family protein n=1 Tax=Oceanobacillus alkalisoli TaxID=2925113 RepID=UPI001EF08D2A|nr:phosphatase PAP2 family protein [Oceanobacillus alkalisoli]MCF3942035.1 phosphatase PAP2 family protein [Oceanobacillus alkalisoli]MCG5102012.1 phosphatase PAP2 family protein [Oceanobacillus alkalisoli]
MRARKNILLLIFIVLIIITGIWVLQLLEGNMPYVDQATRRFADLLGQSFLLEPFQFITHLGSSFFLYPFVAVVTIFLFIWFKHWLPAVFFGGGIYLSHKINHGIKLLITRERPSISVSLNAEGYSFPSGHSMISLVCYGLLAYFITRKLKSKRLISMVQIGFAVLIFLIGISRYIINVHYLTDVLAGFFFGYLLLIGLIFLYEKLMKKISSSKNGEISN